MLISQPLIFVSVPLTLLLGFTVLRSQDPHPDLEVERETEKVRIREGETTRVRLRVRNLGSRPVAMLQIRDRVHAELRGKNTHSGFSSSLKGGETRDFYYEVSANSFGVHTLGPVLLRVQDSTGLFESEAELRSYSELIVFPETTERLGHLAIRPRRTKSWPGEIVARRAGTGMDYYKIRRFMPGDPVKRINWRASARDAEGSDEFLVNEYTAEVGAEVLIVVDAGRARGEVPGRHPNVVYSVKAAISIAERLLHDRNRVGLLTAGENPRRITAGYGRRQFDRIALSLLQLEPGESDIQLWVERSIHMFFPNISQIIFVSPLVDASSKTAAAELTRNGERDVIVVSPNPVGLAKPGSGGPNSREWRIALRLAQIERGIDMDLLRSANALVVDWTTSASLEEVMEIHRRALSKYAALSARHR
ncbi:MAG: DUF58 domain-containing protein [Thaumarchaeota archaeon]|nr:DUF58 domain-containing protein [Nitrososphaerota archaeon]